jgi:hypothetical protein
MSRLSNQLYFERYQFLMTMWLEVRDLYTVLWPNEQWELHAFYQPLKELSEAEFVEHRTSIQKMEPGLASKAGRHFKVLYESYRVAFAYSEGDEQRFRGAISQMSRQRPRHETPGKRQVSVRLLVHPEPDLKMLASAFYDLAVSMAQQKNRTNEHGAAQADG